MLYNLKFLEINFCFNTLLLLGKSKYLFDLKPKIQLIIKNLFFGYKNFLMNFGCSILKVIPNIPFFRLLFFVFEKNIFKYSQI